jgi:gamma-glutamylcyclotransferase (GGCT)/AIG2-like uncharacterized protein YtfP
MVYYFAYGSNMFENQMIKRQCNIISKKKGILYNFELKFNKKSTDGSGKCNIIEKDKNIVEGGVYEIDEDSLQKLTEIEKGYYKKIVHIHINNEVLNCITFVADKDKINDSLKPNIEYKKTVILGAKEFELSEKYKIFINSFEEL